LTHVDEAIANREKFSSFYTSPVLAPMVRDAVARNPKPETTLPHFEKGTVAVDGGDLYYEAAGAGTPVVFIHAHSADRRMWDAQFAALAKSFRVIRYDLRGYGLSDLPREGQKFTHADDLHRLLLALHIQRAHFVGLSLGAFVAGDMIALHTDEVLSASIASGGVHSCSGNPPTPEESKKRLVEIEALRQRGIGPFKHEWMDAMMRSCGPRREEIRAPLWAMIHDWSAWQPLHLEPALLLGEHVLERLAQEKQTPPVLIIAGENDSELSHQSSKRLAKAIRGAKEITIANAGHWSAMEQPEEFTHAISEFISKSK
jgi:pimeloyl-ACP methyl ester carboxylesterase